MGRPALKKQAVAYVMSHHGLSRRRACRLVKQHRSTDYYRSVKDPRTELRVRMREIANVRIRYGYRRVHVLLRREGWRLGRSQAYRLYTEEQLQLRFASYPSGARWSCSVASARCPAGPMTRGPRTSWPTSWPMALGFGR